MTVWLGLRLALRGGREAAVRAAVVAAAVAAGVVLLLSTLSLFNAFQATAGRPCWECTTGAAPGGRVTGVLWNHREDSYVGRTIKRLDVAAPASDTSRSGGAAVVPGVPRLPDPGRYYVSPALARLLDAVPRDRLADRFPGARAGLVGREALSGPDDLVVVVGQPAERLAALADTVEVHQVATRRAADTTTALYRHGFGIAAVGLVLPLLVLVGTASRLAAARREARLAAMRLAGATSRQTGVIASVDAAGGALLGTLAGVALFQLVRPAVAGVTVTGARFFPDLVTPGALQYAVVIAGVPVAAAGAALWSLRRMRITPLGVARREPPPAPSAWRLLPLAAGLTLFGGLFAGPALIDSVFEGPVFEGPVSASPVFAGDRSELDALLMDAGLALVMVGLVTGGPWLTMVAARVAARLTGGAATLLAARRTAADPKAAFRSVTGLVLAVFIGTAIAGIVPAVVSGQRAAGGGTLGDVLRASFARSCPGECAPRGGDALAPEAGAELLSRLRAQPGVAVLPVYAKARTGTTAGDARTSSPCLPEHPCRRTPPLGHVVTCDDLALLPALGRCAAGARAVAVDFERLLTNDNMLAIGNDLPVVGDRNPAVAAPVTGLRLAAVLVRTGDPAVRERVRTLLTPYLALTGSSDTPRTFAEIAALREVPLREIERVALAIVALTLLVAGCGLVVAVGGGLVERRRPFALLRLCGTPVRTLSRVVLLESALPLVVAAGLAAAAGFGVAEPVVGRLALRSAPVALPGPGYFLAVGGGLAASLLVVLAAVPLLRRMTAPDGARFE
ncbi:hypothetical protein JYK22_06765 [Nonomuraea sp. RK-328]|nr:hypothetical protein [Nonomuraea sp. RK-328]